MRCPRIDVFQVSLDCCMFFKQNKHRLCVSKLFNITVMTCVKSAWSWQMFISPLNPHLKNIFRTNYSILALICKDSPVSKLATIWMTYIFKKINTCIFRLQLLKCEYLLVCLLCFECKWKIFWLWTKQDIWGLHFACVLIFYIKTTNQLINWQITWLWKWLLVVGLP